MILPRRRTGGLEAPSLAVNTIAQSSPVMIGYLASFLSAPIILGGLGLRAFGIWALTGALAQYAALLDFGIGNVLTRFVALHDTERDRDAMGEVLVAGLGTIAIIAVFIVLASYTMARVLAHQLGGISPEDMRTLLLCSSGMLCASMLVNVLTAYPVGLRRMIVPNIAVSAGTIVNFAFSVGAILIWPHLVFYALANAAASLITLLLVAVVVITMRPAMPLRIPGPRRLRELVGFAAQNQIVSLTTLVNYQSDKIVIALFVGPAAAGAYELANRIAAAVRGVGVYATSAMVPTFTALRASSSRDVLAGVYVRLTKQTSALAFPLLILCAGLAPLVLRAWLGRTPQHSVVILVGLSLAYVVNTSTGAGNTLAYADGKPGISARAGLVTAVANIGLTLALAPALGVWGVMAGTILALSLGGLYQVVLVNRNFNIPMRQYREATLPTLRICTALVAPVVIGVVLSLGLSRWVQMAICVVLAGVYLGCYSVCALRMGILPGSLTRLLQRRRATVLNVAA